MRHTKFRLAFFALVATLVLALPAGASAQAELTQLQAQLSVDAVLKTYEGEQEVTLSGDELAFTIYRNDVVVGGFHNPPSGEVWDILAVDPGDKVKLCEDTGYERPARFAGYVADATCIEQTMGDNTPPFHFVYRKEKTVFPYFLTGRLKTDWVTPGRYTRPMVWVQGNLVDSVVIKVLSKSRFLQLQVRRTSRFYRNPALADFGRPYAATWLRGELHEEPDFIQRKVWIRWRILPRAWRLRHGARICFRLGMQAKGFAHHPDLSTEEWSSFKSRRYCFRVR